MNSFTNVGRESPRLLPIFIETGEFSRSVRGSLGGGRHVTIGLTSTKLSANSRGEFARGKADIPKQTEHSAERACRRNLFLPFQTERNQPPPPPLWFSFQATAPVRPLYPLDFRYTPLCQRLAKPPLRLAISPFPRQKTIAQGRENSLTFPQLELNTCRFNRKSSLTVISPPLASLSTESILRMLQSDECEFFFLSCSSKRGNFLSREVLPALNPEAPKYVESLHRSFLSFFLYFLFFFFFFKEGEDDIYIYLYRKQCTLPWNE